MGGGNEASITLTKLVKPDDVIDDCYDVGAYTIARLRAVSYTTAQLGIIVLLRPQILSPVWTSTCAPTTGSLAIGTGVGIILIHEIFGPSPSTLLAAGPASAGTFSDWHNRSLSTSSDVLALEYLSEVSLAVGQRNGSIDLVDTRVLDRGRVLGMRHPRAVTHIRKVDEHLVVVNGLQSSVSASSSCAKPSLTSDFKLRMYDLRFPHPASPSTAYLDPTRPLLAFEHENEFLMDMGFDIDVDTGLMAVGTSALSDSSGDVFTDNPCSETRQDGPSLLAQDDGIDRLACERRAFC